MIDENLMRSIYSYCESVTNDIPEALYDLYRETHLKTMAPRMASGALQGRFLSLLSNLSQPHKVLEIGTFTGYATICMAEGLHPDGTIDTIEINPELNYLSDKYFKRVGIRSKITSHVGDAKKIIPNLDGPYDFVFIDAKKKDYSEYFDLIINKVNKGGIILADNVIWDGKVITNDQDPTTQALIKFNQKIKDDPRVNSLLLPLRDGLMIAKKI